MRDIAILVKLLSATITSITLVGCAQDAPVPVQPVSIKSSDFCEIVDKKRDLDWSIHDTPKTITNARRLGAIWDSRCARKPKPTS